MAREFQTIEEIQQILSRGAFEELIGALENEFFEAKSEPWDLETERGRLEMAKDISSLANLRGGIIVVGAIAQEADTYQRNEIQAIHPLPTSLTPGDRYQHVLQEWVYPVPQVDFKWYLDPTDSGRGIIGVYVQDQSPELKPFLVAHYLGEAGKKIDIVFGLFQRLGATIASASVGDLHLFLREGRRLDAIHRKLDTIIAKLEASGDVDSKK